MFEFDLMLTNYTTKKIKKRKGKREKDNKETYTHTYQSLYLFGGLLFFLILFLLEEEFLLLLADRLIEVRDGRVV
jgi:hypothetical protein